MYALPPAPIPEVPLESKVAFLRHPGSFAEPTFRVESIETHMSWVFLTKSFAYKLKKPVRYEQLDFTTIEARHYYCAEEVRLNRRLSDDIYLGVVALTLGAHGHLALGGNDAVLDWLVKMRRLPRRHMLDDAIRHGSVSAGDMQRVAGQLAGLYRTCTPLATDPLQYCARLHGRLDDTMRRLGKLAYHLPPLWLARIDKAQRAALRQQCAVLEARAAAGMLVEGHGDLRPEHICLMPLAMIDCLEFSRELRTVDPIDELAFLALECERLGAGGLGAHLLRAYGDLSGDRPPPALVHFYQSYRAGIRAAIAISHLDEEKFRYSPEWSRRANGYLRLAEQHVARCR